MGSLYSVIGLAHAADCYIGQKNLLVAAGSTPYQDLPSVGQALVEIWCAAGPISCIASCVGGGAADIDLLFYGAVEVVGAAILSKFLVDLGSSGSSTAGIDALMNAVLVQGIVLASLFYSRNKTT